MRILGFLLLVLGCDKEPDASSFDLSSVSTDMAIESCGFGTVEVCAVPVDQLCVNNEAVCACLDGQWQCCHPEIYQCPLQVQTGDYCCPTGINWTGNRDQQCGCRCVDYRYVCDLDGGARD